jgi:hypothetical protein
VRPGSVHDGAMEKFDVVDLNQGQKVPGNFRLLLQN